MSAPIIGILKGTGEIIGAAWNDALLSISAIFRERKDLEEMDVLILSVIGEANDDIVVGDTCTISKGTYWCLIMEDMRDLRVLMSLSKISGVSHLRLLDKYCMESEDMIVEYISSFYHHNERVLRTALSAAMVKDTGVPAPGPLDISVLKPDMSYPTGLVLPDREYFLNSMDHTLVDTVVSGRLKRMPDEAISMLREGYKPHICRYIVTSFHHAHLCMDRAFLPFGLSVADLEKMHGPDDEDPPKYVVGGACFQSTINLLYLRDVLMTMKIIPFEEDVLIPGANDTIAALASLAKGAADPFNHYCVHSYDTKPLPVCTTEDFKKRLEEDSDGLFGPSFDWTGFILTGSTIFSLLLGDYTHEDYDLIYLKDQREDPLTEEDLIAIYNERISPHLAPYHLIQTEKSFRLRIGGKNNTPRKGIDLYFGTKQSIAMYHSAPTNCFFDGTNVWMYPRAVHFAATSILSDLVPLSKDRGLALRHKSFLRHEKYGIKVHMWHKELEDIIPSGSRLYNATRVSISTPLLRHINEKVTKIA